MVTNSIIEMTYITYGWLLYGHLFILFKITGLILLPFLFLGIEAIIKSAVSNEEDGYNVREILAKFLMMVFIYIFTVPPMIAAKIDNTKIETIGCGQVEVSKRPVIPLITGVQDDGSWEEVGIPIVPYLTMKIANTIRSFIKVTAPCMEDVSVRTMSSFSGGVMEAEGNPDLQERLELFTRQCYAPALQKMNEWKKSTNESKSAAATFLFTNSDYDDSDLGIGSHAIQKMFYTDQASSIMNKKIAQCSSKGSACGWGNRMLRDPNIRAELESMANEMPLVMRGTSLTGTSSNENRCYQNEAQKNGTTTCVDCSYPWWGDSSIDGKPSEGSIAYDILNAYITRTFQKHQKKIEDTGAGINVTIYDKGIVPIEIKGYDKPWFGVKHPLNTKEYLANPESYVKRFINELSDAQTDILVNYIFGQNAKDNIENANLSSGSQAAGMGLMIGGGIAKMLSSGLSGVGEIATQLGSNIFTIATVIEAMKVLLPLSQGFVYAFWGIIMIVTFYRGEAVWKAVMGLFSLLLIPAGWDLAEVLTNSLYGLTGFGDDGLSWDDLTAVMSLLTIFYIRMFFFIITPAILFVVLNMGSAAMSASIVSAGGVAGVSSAIGGALNKLGAGKKTPPPSTGKDKPAS